MLQFSSPLCFFFFWAEGSWARVRVGIVINDWFSFSVCSCSGFVLFLRFLGQRWLFPVVWNVQFKWSLFCQCNKVWFLWMLSGRWGCGYVFTFFFSSAFLVLKNIKFPPFAFLPLTQSLKEFFLLPSAAQKRCLPGCLPESSGTFKSLSCSQCSDLSRILNIYGPPHCGNDYDLILGSSFPFSLPSCFLGSTVCMTLCKGLGVNLRNDSIGN